MSVSVSFLYYKPQNMQNAARRAIGFNRYYAKDAPFNGNLQLRHAHLLHQHLPSAHDVQSLPQGADTLALQVVDIIIYHFSIII